MLKWQVLLNGSGAQCASVPINMETSNDSNQPKRKEKVCSQYCVWYLSKGTKGELIVVDSTKGKHYRCPHKQRFFNRLSLLTQTSHTKISAIARCPNFFVPAIITELVKSTLYLDAIKRYALNMLLYSLILRLINLWFSITIGLISSALSRGLLSRKKTL